MYCFLANATNVLQPADGVFRSFKANWRSTVREWKESNANKTLSKTNFTPVFKKAFDAAVDSKKIQNAFKKSGIFPFNVENVDFYKCMQRRHNELQTNKDREGLEVKQLAFFTTLNSEIPTEMLVTFNSTLKDESKIPELKEPVGSCFLYGKSTKVFQSI